MSSASIRIYKADQYSNDKKELTDNDIQQKCED